MIEEVGRAAANTEEEDNLIELPYLNFSINFIKEASNMIEWPFAAIGLLIDTFYCNNA